MTVLFADRAVKTRKPHDCAWCAVVIHKGDTVPYRAYAYEGTVMGEWMHPECREASGHVLDEGGYCAGEHEQGSADYRG